MPALGTDITVESFSGGVFASNGTATARIMLCMQVYDCIGNFTSPTCVPDPARQITSALAALQVHHSFSLVPADHHQHHICSMHDRLPDAAHLQPLKQDPMQLYYRTETQTMHGKFATLQEYAAACNLALSTIALHESRFIDAGRIVCLEQQTC